MAKPSKKVIEALTAIPGVGEATAKKLAAAGMSSKSDVIKAGLKGLKAAGITAGTASKIAKAVASSKVKAVTKKAKPKKSPQKTSSHDANQTKENFYEREIKNRHHSAFTP